MKKIISFALALIMVFGVMPAFSMEAFAWSAPVVEVAANYGATGLKGIKATFDWDLDDASCALVLMKKYLSCPNDNGGTGYGDFTDFGSIYSENYTSLEAVKAVASYGIISYTDFTQIAEDSEDNKLEIAVSGASLNEGTYYIYCWTKYSGRVYPDFLVAAIKIADDGTLSYSPRTDDTRNEYGNTFTVLEESYTFNYAYDCYREPDFPAIGVSTELDNFQEPLNRSEGRFANTAGAWKLSVCAKAPSDSKSFLSNILATVKVKYNMTADPVLYKLTNGGELVAYGYVLAATADKVLFIGDNYNEDGAGYLLSKSAITESSITVTPNADASSEEIENAAAPAPAPTYTVTWVADNTTIKTETVVSGGKATAPAIPAKVGYDQTAPYWNHNGQNITSNTTITAVYTINEYDVEWIIDGVTVDTETVEHGADATKFPTIPEKYGYTQVAPYWEDVTTGITSDTEVNAIYTINKYTVKFIGHGGVVSTQTVEHGSDAAIPEIPVMVGYNGEGWTEDGTNITEDTTIYAIYRKIAEPTVVTIGGAERDEEAESNPNTGAPVMEVLPAFAVIGAAAFLGKKRR